MKSNLFHFFIAFGREALKKIGLIIFVTFAVFLFIHEMPSSDAKLWSISLNRKVDISQKDMLSFSDDIIILKYVNWMGKAVKLDFGHSLYRTTDVLSAVSYCLPITLFLLTGAIIVALILSLAIGVLTAVRGSNFLVKTLHFFLNIFSSTPLYLFGMLAFIGVHHYLRYIHIQSDFTEVWDFNNIITMKFPLSLIMYIIPMSLLGIGNGNLIELCDGITSCTRKILRTEYIKAVRTRGASVSKHVARNLVLDVISLFDARITYLISGAVIIENIFNWNGLGRLGVDAAKDYDYPLIMALVLVFTFIVVIVSLLKMVLYQVLDPRLHATAAQHE